MLPAPRAIASAETRFDNAGTVTPSFDRGSILLKGEGGDYLRLSWEQEMKKGDSRRSVPAGAYTVAGWRTIRRDEQGREWYLSSTARHGQRLVVRAGDEQQIAIDETIHFAVRARAQEGSVLIQTSVMGKHHEGLTMYRDGQRLPLRYVLTAQGKAVASGLMNYG